MVCPEGIEPPTHSLEGCCSIQLSYGQRSREIVVGAKGFEPSTLWSQTRCATRLRYAPTSLYCNGWKPQFPEMQFSLLKKCRLSKHGPI
jgi:hypothetical protein